MGLIPPKRPFHGGLCLWSRSRRGAPGTPQTPRVWVCRGWAGEASQGGDTPPKLNTPGGWGARCVAGRRSLLPSRVRSSVLQPGLRAGAVGLPLSPRPPPEAAGVRRCSLAAGERWPPRLRARVRAGCSWPQPGVRAPAPVPPARRFGAALAAGSVRVPAAAAAGEIRAHRGSGVTGEGRRASPPARPSVPWAGAGGVSCPLAARRGKLQSARSGRVAVCRRRGGSGAPSALASAFISLDESRAPRRFLPGTLRPATVLVSAFARYGGE